MRLTLCHFLLAQADPSLLPKTLNPDAQHSLRGVWPVLLALGVLIGGLVVWAVFFRKSPRTRQRGAILDEETDDTRMSASGRRRRRRRRREHRPRNPSRAETGGLPPPGTGGSSPTPL